MQVIADTKFDRTSIRQVADAIRPFIRRTPVIEVDPADFGLSWVARMTLKLEYLQHSGSFKARGAFTNLLLRDVPAVGVVAASGGNHGAAVAFAAQRLGIPARIFVPSVASPAKLRQIEAYGADLTVTGDRYADALAASKAWVETSGAMEVHAFDQVETLMGQGTVGLEFSEQAARSRYTVRGGGRRRTDRRRGGLVPGRHPCGRGRTRGRADTHR